MNGITTSVPSDAAIPAHLTLSSRRAAYRRVELHAECRPSIRATGATQGEMSEKQG